MGRGGGALRTVLVGGLVAGPVLLCGSPAVAGTEVELVVDASAWSWRRVIPAPLPLSEPSGVPTGALAVAFDGRPGVPAKATYLRLALSELPTGTALSRLALVVPVDVVASDDPAAAPVVACRLTAAFPTGEGLDPGSMPGEDCTGAPVARYDENAAALVVDLTAAGAAWLAGAANSGVVLRPPPDVSVPDVAPYQLVLGGATSVVGRASVSLPGGASNPPAPAAVPPSFAPAPAPGVALPPLLPGGLPAVGAPAPVPAPGPTAAPAPAAVPDRPGPQAAARRPLAATGASPSGFAAAVLGGLAMLAAAGWSLGDTTGLPEFARRERARRDRLRHGAIVVPAPAAAVQPVVGRQTRQGRRPLSSAASTLT